MRKIQMVRVVCVAVAAMLISACSHEAADWKAASTADSTEAYVQFLKQYPNSANAAQAQARIKQIGDDRDWQVAAAADTREAYEQFLAQHADSKWAQEARVRIENFAQSAAGSSSSGGPVSTPATTAPSNTATAVAGAAAAGAGAVVASATPKPAPPVVQHAEPPPRAEVHEAAPVKHAAKHVVAHHAAAHHKGHGGGGGSGRLTDRVQLGAFSSAATANAEWAKISARFPQQLGSHSHHVSTVKTHGGTLYRLQVSTASASAARALCDHLRKESQPCVLVQR